DSGMDDTESEFGGMDDLPSDETTEDTSGTLPGESGSLDAPSMDDPATDEVEEAPEDPETELPSETDDVPDEIPEEEEELEEAPEVEEEEKKDEEEDDIPRF